MSTPTKNAWEGRFDKEFAWLISGMPTTMPEIKAFIRAEKEKSEAETLKKVLEVVDRRTPAPHCSLHDRPKDGTCDACLVNIEIDAAFSDLTDKLTQLTKEDAI